jgi:hypothetical protein
MCSKVHVVSSVNINSNNNSIGSTMTHPSPLAPNSINAPPYSAAEHTQPPPYSSP